jgi:hypothetical protein
MKAGPTGFAAGGELDAIGGEAVFKESHAHPAGDVVVGKDRE